MAGRGFILEALLEFYPGLGTTDVTRCVIIPRNASHRCAYADLMSGGRRRTRVMVTHNCGNLVMDLVAGIVAHALDGTDFMKVVHLLDSDIDVLTTWLRQRHALALTYWVRVCIFCQSAHVHMQSSF